MKRLIAALMLMLSGAAQAYEETVDIPGFPEIRAVLGPVEVMNSHGYVGGQIVMRVQIVSAHAFSALDFRMPEIADADMITLVKPKTRSISTYAGSGWVFETAVSIFPKKSGELLIPPIIAIGRIEQEGAEDVPFDISTRPEVLAIRGVQPGFEDTWWLVSHRVHVEESWSIPLSDLRVGDIVRREVSFSAYGLPEERMPSLTHPDAEGVTISAAGETRRTERSPDGLIGNVTQTWDIRIDAEDVAKIGAVGVQYWNQLRHHEKAVETPTHRIEPLARDSAEIAEGLLDEAAQSRSGALAAGSALVALLLTPLIAALFALIWTRAPGAADRTLKAACRAAPDQASLYRAVLVWSDASGVDVDGRSDAPVYRMLTKRLFGPGQVNDVSPDALCAELTALSRQARADSLKQSIETALARLIGPRTELAPRSS
ncbi:MAG: hypothetical protein AAF401_14775 [Pseudomonadota bacterium]